MNDGKKLERWGNIVTIRPDPQIIWSKNILDPLWRNFHMHYHRSKSGGGYWETKKSIPVSWNINWRDTKFIIHPTDFKHMGLFPEQAANWNWISNAVSSYNNPIRLLNLFGYTGAATVIAAKAGAHVTHVDAAKGMVQWAKENCSLNDVNFTNTRFIIEDAIKFVQREKRRNNCYDAIIMDPPSYGRGPQGEIWKIEDQLFNLVLECTEILSESPKFFLINSYTTGFSPIVASNILQLCCAKKYGGNISHGELGILSKLKLILPCGIFARWEK